MNGIGPLFCSQVHPLLKANSQLKRAENRMENEKQRRNRNIRGELAATVMATTTAHGSHHDQAVVATGQGGLASLLRYVLQAKPRIIEEIGYKSYNYSF